MGGGEDGRSQGLVQVVGPRGLGGGGVQIVTGDGARQMIKGGGGGACVDTWVEGRLTHRESGG